MAVGPPQARIGDFSAGHWVGKFYFPPTPLIQGSPDTFSCCIPASRVGDEALPHIGFYKGKVPFPAIVHGGKARAAMLGSVEKLINFLPAFRIGDPYVCGDIQAMGCPLELVCP